MSFFSWDDREFIEASHKLQNWARRGLPFAVKGTLNQAARDARVIWKGKIEREMITRNRWTVGSIKTDRARGSQIRLMKSVVGSEAPYMETQELGGVVGSKKGAEAKPIPTNFSAGGGRSTAPRRKAVRGPNRMSKITVPSRKGQSRKQRNAIQIKMAVKSGKKFTFLDLGTTKGLFKVMGGKRKPRLEMVWDLSRASITVPKNPTLKPTMRLMDQRMPRIAVREIEKQLRRRGFTI